MDKNYEELRISFFEMESEFIRILFKYGYKKEEAETLANVFATNSLEGIYTHGVNRFARFIDYTVKKIVDANAKPKLIKRTGAIEQWNGNNGPGPLNALFCTERSMKISKRYGLGCVALSNTTHWMRPGYYGWKAAQAGFCFIAWTNTISLIPPWGSTESKLGNNPFVLAVPFGSDAIVLDMAMSQFSYGIMESYKMKNLKLPFAGGFNKSGELTNDAGEILESLRPLPVGYWKGAGMALLFDILAAILSGGLSTHEISKLGVEKGISQVYISFDVSKLQNFPAIQSTIDGIINDYISSTPINNRTEILYPGKRVLETRKENLENGIPVSKKIWDEILEL